MGKRLGFIAVIAALLGALVVAVAPSARASSYCVSDQLGDANGVSPITAPPTGPLPVNDDAADFSGVCFGATDGTFTVTFLVPADRRPTPSAAGRTFSADLFDGGNCASVYVDYQRGAKDTASAEASPASDCEQLTLVGSTKAIKGVTHSHAPHSGVFEVSMPVANIVRAMSFHAHYPADGFGPYLQEAWSYARVDLAAGVGASNANAVIDAVYDNGN